MAERFETMLTGGHPNSLGRTLEVVEAVLTGTDRFGELFDCYQSADEVVRLRTSNAIRRVQAERPDLLIPFYDRLIDEIGRLDQASAQWTLAILFDRGRVDMTDDQNRRAEALIRRNLADHHDWIVLNNSIEILSKWAADDPDLKAWLQPHLERHAQDPRKSVAARARKNLKVLFE